MLERIDPGKWRTSTKIEALVEELSKLKTEDHSIKSLVFSQFTSFLDLIARRLQLAGFKIARLQGNMTPEARDRTCVHVRCAALLQRAEPLFAYTASSTS